MAQSANIRAAVPAAQQWQTAGVVSAAMRNRVMEAQLDGFAKLGEEGLERGAEAEASARREVERRGDLLDVVLLSQIMHQRLAGVDQTSDLA